MNNLENQDIQSEEEDIQSEEEDIQSEEEDIQYNIIGNEMNIMIYSNIFIIVVILIYILL